jgi:hypothetical protein
VDLEQFMNRNGSRSQGPDLTQIGPYSQLLNQRLQNEGRTKALIAAVFWQTFLASDAYPRALKQGKAGPGAWTSARLLIAPQARYDRYDLLILDPARPTHAGVMGIEVNQALFRPADMVKGALVAAKNGTLAGVGGGFFDIALEAGHALQGQVILIAPAPQSESLSVFSPYVTVDDGSANYSTAGVRVKCRATGADGVTAALHGVIGGSASVFVDGARAVVRRTSPINDSAFLEMAAPPTHAITPSNGLMSGMLPRGQQISGFEGRTSGSRTTKIVGFDPQLPNPSPYRQGLIYTGRDAQTGDSGAALVTDDGYLVGFAFERTLPGESPEQCSWIWANSALNALGLDLA